MNEEEMPYSDKSEKGIISAMMTGGADVLDVVTEEGLREEMFFNRQHQLIFREVGAMINRDGQFMLDKIMDNDTIMKSMHHAASYITELYTYRLCQSYVEYDIDTIKQNFLRRSVMEACSVTRDNITPRDSSVNDVICDLSKKLDSILTENTKSDSQLNGEQTAQRCTEYLARMMQGQESGLKTGFRRLDAATGGLRPKELSLVCARPSVGKTALGMAFMDEICMNQKTPTIFYSAEMCAESVGLRFLSRRSGINLGLMMGQPMNKMKMQSIKEAAVTMQNSPIIIDDQHKIKPSEIKAKTRIAVKKHGVKIIFVDYLQDLGAENAEENINPRLRVSNALSTLKGVARELNIHVCVLAQLNREAEEAKFHELHNAMVGDCGDAERVADVMMMIGKDKDYEKQLDPHDPVFREINLTKQRNGVVGLMGGILFKKENATFTDLSGSQIEEFRNMRSKSNNRR